MRFVYLTTFILSVLFRFHKCDDNDVFVLKDGSMIVKFNLVFFYKFAQCCSHENVNACIVYSRQNETEKNIYNVESITKLSSKENVNQNENKCFDKSISSGVVVITFYFVGSKHTCHTILNVTICGEDNFLNCTKTSFSLCFNYLSVMHIFYSNSTWITVYEKCPIPAETTLAKTTATKAASMIFKGSNDFHSTLSTINASINSTTYRNLTDASATNNCSTSCHHTIDTTRSFVIAPSNFKTPFTIFSCFLAAILFFSISLCIFSKYQKRLQNIGRNEVYSTVGNRIHAREHNALVPCYKPDESHYSSVTEDMLFHPSPTHKQKIFDSITSNTHFDSNYMLIEDDTIVQPNVYSRLGVSMCPQQKTYDHLIGTEHVRKDYSSPCDTMASLPNDVTSNMSSESDMDALLCNTSLIDVKSLYVIAQPVSDTST